MLKNIFLLSREFLDVRWLLIKSMLLIKSGKDKMNTFLNF